MGWQHWAGESSETIDGFCEGYRVAASKIIPKKKDKKIEKLFETKARTCQDAESIGNKWVQG